MAWTIEYTQLARRQIKKLDNSVAARIDQYMREHVATLADPRLTGKGLRGPLNNRWRYRVGDYRIICEIVHQRVLILVVEIGHRSDIYRG